MALHGLAASAFDGFAGIGSQCSIWQVRWLSSSCKARSVVPETEGGPDWTRLPIFSGFRNLMSP